MKRIARNILSGLFLLTVLSLMSSCDKDRPVMETQLQIAVDEVFADAVKLTVTPENATSTFYFNVISRSDYSTDEAVIAKDLDEFNRRAASSGQDLSHIINSEISVGTTSKIVDGLTAETAYYAYAYNLSNDGSTGREVTKIEFMTNANGSVNSAFTFKVEDIYARGAKVSIQAEESSTLFYTNVLSEGVFKKYATDPESLGAFLVDEIRRAAENQNVSIEAMVDRMAHRGSSNYYYQTLTPRTTYYVCAVAIDQKAIVLAEPEYTTFTTSAAEDASGDFEVEFTEITTNSAQFLMTPMDPAQLYYMGVFKIKDVDKYKSDEDFMASYIEQAGFLFPMLLSQGESEGHYEDLMPDTEYYVVAFGTDETTYTTSLHKTRFTTQVGSPLSEFEVQIDVINVASTEMVCEFYPNSTDYRYMYDAMPFYYFKDGFTQKDLQEYVHVITDYYMAVMPDMSLEDILKLYLSARGNNRITFRNMAPDIDYYVWAAAIDTEGNVLSDYEMVKVHTKKQVDGQGKVEVKNVDVFKGDEVAQLLPDVFYDAAGSAVAIFNLKLSYVEKEWVYCVFEGDLSKYEDDLCITNLMEQGTFTTPETSRFAMRMNWDTQYTMLAIAKDKNGDWGPLTRYPFQPNSSDPVKPISEFPLDMFYQTASAPSCARIMSTTIK